MHPFYGLERTGVSRQTTIKLAKELGIPVEEKNLGRYEAMTADEIFITSTTKALCWARTWYVYGPTQTLNARFAWNEDADF